jgi:hypothetical protein
MTVLHFTEKVNGIKYLYASLDNDPDDYMGAVTHILKPKDLI